MSGSMDRMRAPRVARATEQQSPAAEEQLPLDLNDARTPLPEKQFEMDLQAPAATNAQGELNLDNPNRTYVELYDEKDRVASAVPMTPSAAPSPSHLESAHDALRRAQTSEVPAAPTPTAAAERIAPRHEATTEPEMTEARQLNIFMSAQRVVEAIDAGLDPTKAYMNVRPYLNVRDIATFDEMLREEEQRRGTPLGIRMGASTPVNRLRRNPDQPAWAGKYAVSKEWIKHQAGAYGDLTPLSLEQIRVDPKKRQLFGEFMTAVDPSKNVFNAIARGEPLNAADRKFLEYCQYEFTFQFLRAEKMERDITPKDIEALMKHNVLLGQLGASLGAAGMHAFYKEEVYRMATRDKANFNRLVNGMHYMRQVDRRKFLMNDKDRAQRRGFVAELLATRLQDDETKARLDRVAFGGTAAPRTEEAGVQSAEQTAEARTRLNDEFSPARMKEMYKRDEAAARTPDGRPFARMTPYEQSTFRNSWIPPEARKKTEGQGFWAKMFAAMAMIVFKDEREKLMRAMAAAQPQSAPQQAAQHA